VTHTQVFKNIMKRASYSMLL